MAKSQFEKRKAKDKSVELPVSEPLQIEQVEPVVIELPNLGYDVYQNKETRQYEVAVFRYDPITKIVVMDESMTISRSVALKYQLDRSAFKVLIKKKKVQGV